MEANQEQCNQSENEEYVLLDLESVCMPADIPSNAPYTLSGLDTLNPTLTIGNHLKLIGEYQETIGTCLMFSEKDPKMVVTNTETRPVGGDLFKDQQQRTGQNQVPTKHIQHVATVYKILKFRPAANFGN